MPWPTGFCRVAAGRKKEEKGKDIHYPHGPEIKRTTSKSNTASYLKAVSWT